MDILIEEFEEQAWTAALNDGQLYGLEVDPAHEEVRWGSIYWAKVTRIDAALDAAFLDLDQYNTGILYNKDVRITDKNGKVTKGGEKAIGKVLRPGQMIPVQAKSAYLPKLDDEYASEETKTPVMSMDITLPGRHLIYCPMMEKNRISTRIVGKTLRDQMTAMLDGLDELKGYILRASAANTQTDVLLREASILNSVWSEMQPYFEGGAGQLIMLGPDAIQRTLSDQADQPIERIEVTTMDQYQQVEEWCSIFAPDLIPKIEPIELDNATEDLALFHERDIIGQIEHLFQVYAFLPGGGNIIIQENAALTAIDVNRGADDRSNLEINITAAQEAARQIKLRNMGGAIYIDFINLKTKKDKDALLKALKTAVNQDPCTTQVHGFTNLGLMEISRKRRTPPLQDRFDGIFE